MTKADPRIDKLLGDMNKKYGENSLMRAREVPVRPAIPSGSLALDYAIGIGGMPSDRVVELAGQEGSGKTTLGLYIMREFLDAQPDRYVLILDTEHKLSMDWVGTILGPERMDRVLNAWPEHMEEATNMYVDTVGTGAISMVLLDSIGGSPSRAAVEKDAEKVQVGGNAGPVTKFARLAATFSAKHHCLTLCVNQVRDDMEGFRRHMTPGGRGFKHACILRIKLRKSTSDKVEAVVNGEKVIVGNKVTAAVIKNQLAIEGRVASWWFYSVDTDEYGFGIDTTEECVRLGIATGVIEQTGAWYRHPALPADGKGERRVQGQRGLVDLIKNDESLRQTIVSEVMAVLSTDKSVLSEVVPIDESVIESDGEGDN